MSLVVVVRGEEELGPQRFCPDCRSWWPDTAEFFVRWAHWSSARCSACHAAHRERLRLAREAETAAVRREAKRAVWRRQQASWRARRGAAA